MKTLKGTEGEKRLRVGDHRIRSTELSEAALWVAHLRAERSAARPPSGIRGHLIGKICRTFVDEEFAGG